MTVLTAKMRTDSIQKLKDPVGLGYSMLFYGTVMKSGGYILYYIYLKMSKHLFKTKQNTR